MLSRAELMFPEIAYHEPKNNTTEKSVQLEDLRINSNVESTKESIQSRDKMSRRAESKLAEFAHASTDNKTSMTFDQPASSTSKEPDEPKDSASKESDEARVVVKPYLELHRAAMKGDWEIMKSFLEKDPNTKTAGITGYNETVLHVAAWMEHARVMKELLKIYSPEELEIQSTDGKTVLHIAAMGENLEIVKALVEANPKLTQMADTDECTPLLLAAYYSSKEVVRYLGAKTTNDAPGKPFTGPVSAYLIITLIQSGTYDVALALLERHPQMATAQTDNGFSLLTQLAIKRSDFLSGRNLSFWELWIHHVVPYKRCNGMTYDIPRSDEEIGLPGNFGSGKNPLLERVLTWIKEIPWKFMKQLVPRIKHIEQEKLKHMDAVKLIHHACRVISNLAEDEILAFFKNDPFMEYAATNGVVEIVTIIYQYFPNLLWWYYNDNENIFQIAIKHRREKIVNLLYEKIAILKKVSARRDNNGTLLHKVAELAPYSQLRSTPCPAIQMQREIQWFKGVESMIQPFLRPWVNGNDETADQVFTNEHKGLIKEAEKWMKDTSNSCMLVATLIATVVFAAAFTVPGGNIDGKGTPIFLKEATFIVFAISNALALFSSTTSILMFLSILTARYAEDDFLCALPKRLILGLASLFIAIIAMMVAFGSALEIMLSEKWQWFYIPIVVLGCIPVALFMMLQIPLFAQMVWSTYGPGIFHSQKIW